MDRTMSDRDFLNQLLTQMSKASDDLREDIKEIRTEVKENTKVTESVLAQTTKTNGRVTELERWRKTIDDKPFVAHAENVEIKPNAWNDPKLVGAVITLLGAIAGFLIFIAQKGPM